VRGLTRVMSKPTTEGLDLAGVRDGLRGVEDRLDVVAVGIEDEGCEVTSSGAMNATCAPVVALSRPGSLPTVCKLKSSLSPRPKRM
jgi:hypothetical protein